MSNLSMMALRRTSNASKNINKTNNSNSNASHSSRSTSSIISASTIEESKLVHFYLISLSLAKEFVSLTKNWSIFRDTERNHKHKS